MNQTAFENWVEFYQKTQQPLQELTNLNIQTMASFTKVSTADILDVKKPEEIFEKQVKLAVENGQKVLDYAHKSYAIVEKSALAMVKDIKSKKEAKK